MKSVPGSGNRGPDIGNPSPMAAEPGSGPRGGGAPTGSDSGPGAGTARTARRPGALRPSAEDLTVHSDSAPSQAWPSDGTYHGITSDGSSRPRGGAPSAPPHPEYDAPWRFLREQGGPRRGSETE